MTIDLDTLRELKCPLCRKSLNSDEYEQATEELKAKLAEEYEEQNRKERQYWHQQIEEERNRHRLEREEQAAIYKDQIEAIKRNYDELKVRNDQDFKEKTSEHEQELYDKDRELQKLQNSTEDFKKQAIVDAKASVQNELDQKDIQIRRYKEKADELGRQLSKTQPELKGDTGEINLLKKLEDAFRKYNDVFTTQIRGNPSADIIHQIRTTSGELLRTRIAYDNKEASSVTAKDIEKANRDKKALETDYFIIVSKNLPKKEAKNGLCGEKEGILLAHPDIIAELANIIRTAIIEISKQSVCKQDLQTKQSKIYDLIRSREFRRHIEFIAEAHKKLTDLQREEKRDHEMLWKRENAIFEELIKRYNEVSTGIDVILDKQDLTEIKSLEKAEDIEKESSENDKDEDHSLK
jgi:hypothetical protein